MALVLKYLFKDIYIVNNLEKQRQYLPPEQKAGLFSFHSIKYYKDYASLLGKDQAALVSIII